MDSLGKWILGGVLGIATFILTIMINFQHGIDLNQNAATAQVRQEATDYRKEQRAALERFSDNNRMTAEALKEVATTLKEIDMRGSKALREHERIRGEEAH